MEKIEKKIKELIKEIEHLAKRFDSIGSFYSLRYEINELGENELTIDKTEYIEDNIENIGKIEEGLSDLPIVPELEFSDEDKEDLLSNDYDDGVYQSQEESLKSINDTWYNYSMETTDLLFDTFNRLKGYTYTLIDLLDKNLQKEYKDRLIKINIEYIQKKKYLNVNEFAEVYHMSKTQQQTRRGRLHDPLPYHQHVEGGKILYDVEEIEKWRENGNK